MHLCLQFLRNTCLLQDHTQQLAAASVQLEKESEELRRTAKALEVTKAELNSSNAALQLSVADNERLQAQIEEAKQALRAAQVLSFRN